MARGTSGNRSRPAQGRNSTKPITKLSVSPTVQVRVVAPDRQAKPRGYAS